MHNETQNSGHNDVIIQRKTKDKMEILQLRLQNRNNLLWPPCVADADIIFLSCGFFYLLTFFIPRLFAAVADWMSTILPHMAWP